MFVRPLSKLLGSCFYSSVRVRPDSARRRLGMEALWKHRVELTTYAIVVENPLNKYIWAL